MGRGLIILGLAMVITGLLWPWLSKLGLGQLPGDFRFERKGMTFYFPLASSLLVSIMFSLIIWIFRR